MTATRARAMHKRNPALSVKSIAYSLKMTRQAVERALASTGKRGRPGRESRPVRLSAGLLDRVETIARETGLTPQTLIEGAISVWIVHWEKTREVQTKSKRRNRSA